MMTASPQVGAMLVLLTPDFSAELGLRVSVTVELHREGSGEIVSETHTSNGADEDLGDDLLKAMGEQLRVTKRFFVDLVGCTRSRAEYEAELRGPQQDR